MFIQCSDGFQIYFDSCVSGPNLLLFHGFGDDHYTWHKTSWVNVLAPCINVITMDIRGCGESVKSDKPAMYSLERHCQDIDTSFAEFPHKENSLRGWSLGAAISLDYSKTRTGELIA